MGRRNLPPPPGGDRTAERLRSALSVVGIIVVVGLAVLFITGGVQGVAEFLHVSERDVVPISLGVIIAAWLLWRAITLSRRAD